MAYPLLYSLTHTHTHTPSHPPRYDVDGNHFIDFMELKLMMEKLGEPQTHLALKEMIKTVDEDNDGCISFREVCVCVCACINEIAVLVSRSPQHN